MIQELQHTDVTVARKIHRVFQLSYAVEADLLKAVNFPPLQRNLADFVKSQTDFHGYFKDDDLAAVTEIKSEPHNTHIQSLVVDPSYFRQGIGKSLLFFVLNTYKSATFTVETGLDNLPAIALYKKFGFMETKQWDTDHGVRKVRFQKEI